VNLIANVVATILVLLVPVALIYGWVCFFTPVSEEVFGWRKGATLVSLVLASVVILLWPVLMVLMPGADWRSGVGVAHQVQWVSFWVRAVFRALLAALILGLIGRPRLILPIVAGVSVLGCCGCSARWIRQAGLHRSFASLRMTGSDLARTTVHLESETKLRCGGAFLLGPNN